MDTRCPTNKEYGALDLKTGRHVLPEEVPIQRTLKDADKDTYACPKCHGRVMIKQGVKVRHHFAHYANSGCTYYDHTIQTRESDAHIEAKHLMQRLLVEGPPIVITQRMHCKSCLQVKRTSKTTLLLDDGDEVAIEHEDGRNKYDVAVLRNNELKFIIEIKQNHPTTKPRPEPWYEIDAAAVIEAMTHICKSSAHSAVLEFDCERRQFDAKCTCLYRYIPYQSTWLQEVPRQKDYRGCALCDKNQPEQQFYTIDGEEKALCIQCLRHNNVEDVRVSMEYKRPHFIRTLVKRLRETEAKHDNVSQKLNEAMAMINKKKADDEKIIQFRLVDADFDCAASTHAKENAIKAKECPNCRNMSVFAGYRQVMDLLEQAEKERDEYKARLQSITDCADARKPGKSEFPA